MPLTQDDVLPLKNDVAALGNRINKASHTAHNKINKLISMKIIFALRDPRVYRQGIQAFYHVFKTFESQWQKEMKKDTPVGFILKEVWLPPLARTGPLEEDLMFYYQDESKFRDPVMPEQIAFVEHIIKVTNEKPHLLLAYGHVMYLALFAGGRILKSNISKSAGLFPQVKGLSTEEVSKRGTNFFRFDVEDDEVIRVTFKRQFELATRDGLTEIQKREIIDESLGIFDRNIAMISELEQKNRDSLVSKLGFKVYRYSKVTIAAVLAILLVYFTFFRLFSYFFL